MFASSALTVSSPGRSTNIQPVPVYLLQSHDSHVRGVARATNKNALFRPPTSNRALSLALLVFSEGHSELMPSAVGRPLALGSTTVGRRRHRNNIAQGRRSRSRHECQRSAMGSKR